MVNLGSMIRTALSDSYSRVVLVNPWDLRNDHLWGNSSHKLKHGTETPRLKSSSVPTGQLTTQIPEAGSCYCAPEALALMDPRTVQLHCTARKLSP